MGKEWWERYQRFRWVLHSAWRIQWSMTTGKALNRSCYALCKHVAMGFFPTKRIWVLLTHIDWIVSQFHFHYILLLGACSHCMEIDRDIFGIKEPSIRTIKPVINWISSDTKQKNIYQTEFKMFSLFKVNILGIFVLYFELKNERFFIWSTWAFRYKFPSIKFSSCKINYHQFLTVLNFRYSWCWPTL